MTATYNPTNLTIEISGIVNTIDSIYTDINNPSILSKSIDTISGITTYNLTANILIPWDSVLNMEGQTLANDTITSVLAFNEPSDGYYSISVYGYLYIKNFGITTSTNYVWNISTKYIKYVNNVYIVYGKLFLDNVDISKCGKGDNIPGIKLGEYPLYTEPVLEITWSKIKVHDLFDNSEAVFQFKSPLKVTFDNCEFYNIQNGWRIFDFSGCKVINSKFHDIGITYGGGNLIIQWGGGKVENCEFYNITAPTQSHIYFTKEGEGPVSFSNNYIHDCNVMSIMGIYASNITNKIIMKNNIVDRCTVQYTAWWFANQYLGGVSITSEFSNNTFTNITGDGFQYHSGGRNAIIKDNVLQCTGTSFMANYWPSQAGGGIYNPGDSADSMLMNMILTSIVVNDLDYEPTGSPSRGKLLPFINVKYNTVNVSKSDDYFYDYKYIDVKIIDINNTPISNATVSITNNTNLLYPSINMNRDVKTSFTTKADGHTPLPSDALNTAVILNNLKNSVSNTVMKHSITATYNSVSNTVTNITPDSTWYRHDPNIPTNTITIQLPIDIGCPIPICNINITQV